MRGEGHRQDKAEDDDRRDQEPAEHRHRREGSQPEQAQQDRHQDGGHDHQDQGHDDADEPDDPDAEADQGTAPGRLGGAAEHPGQPPQQQPADHQDAHVPPQGVQCAVGQGGRLRLLGLAEVDPLAATDRAALGVVAGRAEHAPGDRAVHLHPPGAEDEVAADLGARGDAGLPGRHQRVLADASLDADLAAGGSQVTVDLSRDGRAAGGGQQVPGDRAGHDDLAPAGDQVAVDPAVDPHRPSGGDQVTLDRLPGRDGHLPAGPHLSTQLALLGGRRGRQERQRDGDGHDALHQWTSLLRTVVRAAC
jgi:hypothetical protein